MSSIAAFLDSATPPELGALVFGVTYVVLAARGNVWCWPAGIIASALSLAVALQSDYRLDALKESYYVGMGVYGWYHWTARRTDDRATPIVSNSAAFNAGLIVFGLALSAIIGYAFDRLGSSLPYLDAATTVFAFTTTWLVARKVIENWLYWIVVNCVSIHMYVVSQAYFFSMLLGVYTVVAVLGYVRWRRLLAEQSANQGSGPHATGAVGHEQTAGGS